jgi:hypothetical protein
LKGYLNCLLGGPLRKSPLRLLLLFRVAVARLRAAIEGDDDGPAAA